MCCEPSGYTEDQIDGECPVCGAPTVNDDAFEQCAYSHYTCESCHCAPCDDSC